MTEYADPEKHFAISLSLAVVRNEDFQAVTSALLNVRKQFGLGGSTISVEQVDPKAIVNRAGRGGDAE